MLETSILSFSVFSEDSFASGLEKDRIVLERVSTLETPIGISMKGKKLVN